MIHYGRDESGQIRSKNVLERIWLNSTGDSDDECWETTFKDTGSGGHVRIRLDDKSRIMLHRLSYEAHHAEPIPAGMQVNHYCDNPKCFNPHHLYLGNQSSNMQDRMSRGRANVPTKLTNEQVTFILNSSKSNKELSEMFGVTRQAIAYRKKHGHTTCNRNVS